MCLFCQFQRVPHHSPFTAPHPPAPSPPDRACKTVSAGAFSKTPTCMPPTFAVGSDPHPIELLEARICGAVAAQSHRSGRCRFSRSLPLLRTPYTRDLVTIWSLPLSFGKLTLVENFLTPVAFLYQGCSGSCNSILCFSVLEKGFTKRVQSCRQCRFICGDQYYSLRFARASP
jgi:hypothetical protein